MSYYQKNIYPFVEKLIREHNEDPKQDRYELSVNELDLFEQHDFAKHLIEYHERELTCIYENDFHDEITSSLLNLLKNETTEKKIDFAELVRDKVVEYYKQEMQTIIDDIIGWVQQEDYSECGYQSLRDKENGETFWVRH